MSGVRAADRTKEIKDFSQIFKAEDTVAPTVGNATVKGNRTIEVQYSEDVRAAASNTSYRLNGKALSTYSVSNISYNPETYTATISFGADLPVGTHELTVSAGNAVNDHVGLPVVETKKSVTVAENKATPKIVSANLVKDPTPSLRGEFVKVVFDKDLAADSFVDNKNRVTSYVANGSIQVDGNNATAAVIEGGVLYLQGTGYNTQGNHVVRFNVIDDLQERPNHYLVDSYGITVPNNTTITYAVNVDADAPEITKVEAKDVNKVLVYFNEDVSTGATTIGNYVIKNAKGEEVAISKITQNPSNLGNDVVEITTTTSLKAGVHTLTVKNVEDTKTNKMPSTEKSFTVGDVIAPNFSAATFSVDSNKAVTIYVQFDEELLASTITDKANYNVNGKNLPASASVVSEQDGKVAKIIIPSSEVNNIFGVDASLAGTTVADVQNAVVTKLVRVANVKDLSGNNLAGLSQEKALSAVSVIGASTFTNGDTVRVTGSRTVQITLNKTLAELDPANFQVSFGGGTANVLGTSTFTNNSNGTSTVTLNVDKDLTVTDSTAVNGSVTVITNQAAGNTKSLDGAKIANALAITASAADADYVKPQLVSVTQVGTANGTTNLDKFTLKFSEGLDTSVIGDIKYDLVLKNETTGDTLKETEDYTINTTDAANGNITITLLNKATKARVSVSLANTRFATDANENAATAFSNVIVKDSTNKTDALLTEAVAPTVKSIAVAPGAVKAGEAVEITVTFTEAVEITGTLTNPLVAVTGGTLGTPVVDTTKSVKSIKVTYTAGSSDATNTLTAVDLTGLTLTDGSGNVTTGASVTGLTAATITVDATAPSLATSTLAADDKVLTIKLNESISAAISLADLKAAIKLATDGTTFNALTTGDTVAINASGELVITFASPLTTTTNKVSIDANALQDAVGNKNAAITTNAIDATTN